MGRCANPAESCSPADAAPLAVEREIGAREPESRTLGPACLRFVFPCRTESSYLLLDTSSIIPLIDNLWDIPPIFLLHTFDIIQVSVSNCCVCLENPCLMVEFNFQIRASLSAVLYLLNRMELRGQLQAFAIFALPNRIECR